MKKTLSTILSLALAIAATTLILSANDDHKSGDHKTDKGHDKTEKGHEKEKKDDHGKH